MVGSALDMAHGPVFANFRFRVSPKIKGSHYNGKCSRNHFSRVCKRSVLAARVGEGRKMNQRLEDFLCLILPEILLNPFFSHISEIVEVSESHFSWTSADSVCLFQVFVLMLKCTSWVLLPRPLNVKVRLQQWSLTLSLRFLPTYTHNKKITGDSIAPASKVSLKCCLPHNHAMKLSYR